MTRHYDNERLGMQLKRMFRFRRQRRKAQGYKFSTGELNRRAIKAVFTRQDELVFVSEEDEYDR